MKEPRKKKSYKGARKDCLSCKRPMFIGSGGYTCNVNGETILVIDEWMPAEGYKTHCKKWVEQ